MTRYEEAMKDVASCDKLRVAANRLLSGDLRMGQPTAVNPAGLCTSGVESDTQRTETSKYLEEKKTPRDSLSSGERTGK